MATIIVNTAINLQINFVVNGTITNVDFGDGSPISSYTNTNVIHNYATSGLFTITFTSTSLTSCGFYNNFNITSVDLSSSANLQKFDLTEQPYLTSVDLSSCGNLGSVRILNCYSLTTLDLTSTNILDTIDINRTQLSSINLTSKTNLRTITVTNSKLTTINVSPCTLLKGLTLNNNSLTSITFGTHNNLGIFGADLNNLSTIDLSGLPVLFALTLNSNLLTSLNISSNSGLSKISLSANNFNGAALSSILIALDNFGLTGGGINVRNQIPPATITTAGLIAISNLQAKAWNIAYIENFFNVYQTEIWACDAKDTKTVTIATADDLEIGGVYDVSGKTKSCGQVVGASYTISKTGGETFDGPYVDCDTCNAYETVLVRECFSQRDSSIYELRFSAFTGPLNLQDTYYLDFLYPTGLGSPAINIVGCYQIVGFGYINIQTIFGELQSETLELSCIDCIEGNSLTYLVYHCNDLSQTHYISLPDDSLIGHLITFNDISSGLEQFCGIVDSQQTGGVDILLINDLGLYTEELCSQCLSTVADKRTIVDCLDSNHTEVVWNSIFFETNDVSNLSTSDGCFTVSALTDADVTIQAFLNFDPQPDCQDCIQCNGVTYTIGICGSEDTYTISAYQYLAVGQTFFWPELNTCAFVISVTPGLTTDPYYSLRTFDSCGECEFIGSEIWNTIDCVTNQSIIAAFPSGMTVGDISHVKWGETDLLCVTLMERIPGTFAPFASDGITHNDCLTCESTIQLGLTLVNCKTGIEKYITVASSVWQTIAGYSTNGSVPFPVVSDNNFNCYYVSNLCPISIQQGAEVFTPDNYYYNCPECALDNIDPNPARSANTETYICNYCCDCGASGETINQVVVPHPIWSDKYGTWVTQMNMVLIGSGNGLNG